MRTTPNTLPIERYRATKKVITHIFNGDMDYGNWEKAFYLSCTGVASYFVYEASKLYFTYGSEGTQYLPFGNFSKKFGGDAAFWSNASMALYIIMVEILLTARTAYRHHKIKQKLGLSPAIFSWQILNWDTAEISFKSLGALTFSIASGTMMALIDGDENGVYNQVVTGSVNTLLNYLGSYAFITTSIHILYKKPKELFSLRKCLYQCQCEQNDVTSQTSQYPTAKNNIADHFSNKSDDLDAISNDETDRWNNISTLDGYLNFILSPSSSDRLVSPLNNTSHCKLQQLITSFEESFTGKNIIIGAAHLFIQFSDKVSLWGYLKQTISGMKKPPFNLENQMDANIAGSLMFLPFALVSTYFLFLTIQEYIQLLETLVTKWNNFKNNPNYSSLLSLNMAIISIAAATTFLCYFPISYTSSNTSLKLNADYGLDSMWSIILSTIAVTLYNGYGFLGAVLNAYCAVGFTSMMLKQVFDTDPPTIINSAEKGSVLYRHNQTMSLFKNTPDMIDQMVENDRYIGHNL